MVLGSSGCLGPVALVSLVAVWLSDVYRSVAFYLAVLEGPVVPVFGFSVCWAASRFLRGPSIRRLPARGEPSASSVSFAVFEV